MRKVEQEQIEYQGNLTVDSESCVQDESTVEEKLEFEVALQN